MFPNETFLFGEQQNIRLIEELIEEGMQTP